MKKLNPQELEFHYKKIKDQFFEKQRMIYNITFIIAIVFLIFSIRYFAGTLKYVAKETTTLSQLDRYSFNRITSNEELKDKYNLWHNLSDVIDFSQTLQTSISNRTEHKLSLSDPYDHFLQFMYVPSINMWRDPFTLEIDTTLIGKKFIDNNPYDDIKLIEKWTDFFKEVGLNSALNEITSISVAWINPAKPWYFSVPITVNFEAPNKRSFLLLINKVSTTAYIDNISLVNEFTYYLRNNIKDQHTDIIEQNIPRLSSIIKKEITLDVVIGYMLREWLTDPSLASPLLTNEVIDQTIKETAWCISENEEQCLYKFRQKVASVPYLAYGVGRSDIDKIEWLRYFYNNLPPLITIDDFSFQKKDSKNSGGDPDTGYVGTFKIQIYGTDVYEQDLDDIRQELWEMCFVDGAAIDVSDAQDRINQYINELNKDRIDTQKAQELNRALDYVNKIASSYAWLSNFKKVVRMFEIYRTLKENNLCDIISSENNPDPLGFGEEKDVLDEDFDDEFEDWDEEDFDEDSEDFDEDNEFEVWDEEDLEIDPEEWVLWEEDWNDKEDSLLTNELSDDFEL